MDAIADHVHQDQSQDLFFTLTTDGDTKSGLVVHSFNIQEGLSKLFTVELELASRRSDIDLTKLLDKPACLRIEDRYGKTRFFHGLVEEVEKGASGRPNDRGLTWTMYRMTLMPAAHKLRYASDMRIFMEKSVPEIVDTILRENGVDDFKFIQTEKHLNRQYCTQYRETMWEFFERLLAEEGFFYYHSFEEDKHTLVISDRSIIAQHCLEEKLLEFNPNHGGDVKGSWISQFAWTEAVRSSRVTLNDYTFHNPMAGMQANAYAHEDNGLTSQLAVYDYPGRYKNYKVGEDFARYEIDSLRVDASRGHGVGHCQYLMPGWKFTLQGHEDKALNRDYLLVDVEHRGTQPQALEEAAGEGNGTFYETRFNVIKDTTPWRPSRKQKPFASCEIAIVTGPDSESLYTDEYGRIKCHFPWDRHGKKDDTSSCWIRVAQSWGGGMYGNMAIPRIGHEVIISFLGADPDQPICSGRTYHANNLTPYKLPEHKTKMVIRSDNHKNDGTYGYNEISMEDENGQQNFFMRAEKDHTLKVMNNQIASIDANAMQTIGENHALNIGKNASQQVGGGMNLVVGAASGAAAALLTSSLSGLTGTSAALLQKGMSIAGGDSGGGGEHSKESGGGGNSLASFATVLASGGGSALSQLAGGLDTALGGIGNVASHALRSAGGASMAEAGSSLASSLASLIGGGVFNQLVATSLNQTTGGTATEQVGLVKVSTIGKVSMESVGHTKHVSVGEEFVVGVGSDKDGKPMASFTMKKNGDILLNGVRVLIEASGPIIHKGKVIDLN